jgi:hypothetical protein
MKDFLNRYMASNQNLQRQSIKDLSQIFEDTTAIIAKSVGSRAFRPVRAINAAVIDSVMTGVARRLTRGPIKKKAQLAKHYQALLKSQAYRKAVETGTSQEANVVARLRLATKAFASVR